MSREDPTDAPRGDAPAAAAEGDARPDLVERLGALEASLRDVANEISVTRERLARSPEEEPEPVPGRDGARVSEDAPAARAVSTGRARLRESPLGDLFRSTIRPDHDRVQEGASSAAQGRSTEPLEPVSALELVPEPSGEHPGEADARGDVPDQGPWLDERIMEIEPRRARMLANSESLLGPEHPDTLWAAHDLAFALGKAGEVTGAWRLAARLVKVRSRLQGADHPHTVRAYELRVAVTERPGRRPR